MKSFKKIFLMLTSFAMVVGTLLVGGSVKKTETVEAAETVESEPTVNEPGTYIYNFANSKQFSTWGTRYANHIISYNDITVDFTSANKQTTTIKDIPVTKGDDVSFNLNSSTSEMYYVKGFTFKCRKWGSNTHTMTLYYSTDGTSYKKTGDKSSNFTASYVNEKDGYVCGGKVSFSGSKQVGIESLTIEFAEKEFNVSFVDSNGAQFADQKAIRSKGYKIEPPSNPTKEGYTFDGWYLEEEGKSDKWDFINDVVTKDMTLVAHYKINSYKVTFDLNGGTINGSTDSVISNVEYNNKVSAPAFDPTKKGFIFKSWNTVDSEGKITTTEYNFENLITNELILMAYYEEVTEPLAVITPSQQTYYVNDKIIVNAELNNVPEGSTYELIWSFDPSVEGIVAKDEESSTPTKLVLDALKPGEVMLSVTLKYNGNSYSNNDNMPLVTILDHPISSVETKSWLGLSYENSNESITYNIATMATKYGWKQEDNIGVSKDFPEGRNDLVFTATNGSTPTRYWGDDTWRFYKGATLKIESTDKKISSITIDGNKTVVNNNIFNKSFSDTTKIKEIIVELEGSITFTNIRARFGITIPKDTYQFDSIKSANVSFKVNIAGSEKIQTITMSDDKMTINDDGSITYVVSVVNIPLANCKDVIHVVPTITINGHSYELAGTAYSVYQMVDAYLAQDAFKDNAYLTALKASIDAATNVA